MTETFERSNEWGGFTIHPEVNGFLLEYHTHIEGELDGIRIHIPYGTWGFDSTTDLNAPHHEAATNGEALADLALEDATRSGDDRKVKVLCEGVVLTGKTRENALADEPVHSGSVGQAVMEEAAEEPRESWYSFSLKKEDEAGYGDCHDLFTTMYLTHGMPHGLALWTMSDYATDENMFFAQIPAGMEVGNDPFFTAFPLTPCEAPAMSSLSMLVGHIEETPEADPEASKGRRWKVARTAATRTAA